MNMILFQNIGILNRELLERYNIQLPKIRRREKTIKGKLKFKNKVVVITGASSGIGKACVYEFTGQGAKVVLASRRENELKKIEDERKNKKCIL